MKYCKKVCQTLKEVRKQIADANEIPYEITECKHEGNCPGTCPKCESELRYIENQLNLRRAAGKAISLVGISLGISATFGSCSGSSNPHPNRTLGAITPIEEDGISNAFANTSINDTIAPELTTEGIMVDAPQKEILDEPCIEGDIEIEEEPLFVGELDVADSTDVLKGNQVIVDLSSESGPFEGEEPEKDQVFTVVEQLPEFPGGDKALMAYIRQNLKYPLTGENCVQGRVILSFIVEKDGSISDINVMRSPAEELTKEAIRLIESMPKWKPGKQRGKEVRVRYVIPITFRLE